MRIVELTAHVQILKRTQTLESPTGQSATAAAAYRACTMIACERTGLVHDYRRKGGLVAAGVAAPTDAPAWATDRARLWNAAEMRERNKDRGPNARAFKANAVVAREFLYGFPAELSPEGRLNVAQTVARHMVTRYGVVADYAIHEPGKDGDQRNFHCHMMVTSRRMTPDGLTVKTREWDAHANGPRHVKAWRAYLAKTLNDALAAEGKAGRVFVEHRSFKDRGSSQKPTRHQGKAKTNGARKARKVEREAWRAKEQAAMATRHEQEQHCLNARQRAEEGAQLRDTAEQQATTAKALDALLARNPEPVKPAGLAARIADRLTGRSSRAVELAERIRAHEARIAEMKAEIVAERQALAVEQRREAKAQAERHRAEAEGLEKAVAARVAFDRAAEVQARRDEVRHHERDREHDQERARDDGRG
ncbi:MobA/MobL family protein [Methylobacterium tarhaniae]|uniref:MobA/MobL family protein n=1 Tax=Methylobacterium tarhaniae TaxID=1187852 RepID=UPI003D03AB49